MKKIFSIIATLSIITAGYAQVLERSQGILRLSEQVISADSYFSAGSANETIPIRTNSIYMTILSAEYGLTDRITLSGVVPVFVRTVVNNQEFNQSGTVNPGGALNSLGDAEISVRYAVLKKESWKIIGLGVLGLPLGKRGDVTNETNLATGDGEFNQMVGVQLHKTFTDFFAAGYLVYNNRTDNYSNEIRYGFEAGYSGAKFSIKAHYNVIESLFNDDAVTSRNGIFSNHREAFMPGVSLRYKFNDQMAIISSADFITGGRNTLNAPMWGLGFEISL